MQTRNRRSLSGRIVVVVLLLAVFYSLSGSLPTTRARPLADDSTAPFVGTVLTNGQLYRYYPETGHNVGGLFLQFYDAHGGKAIFGLPLTEAITVTSVLTTTPTVLTVQYFEHARLELPPDASEATTPTVQISPLGSMLAAEREDAAFQPQPLAIALPGQRLFPVAGKYSVAQQAHPLRGQFGIFWKQHGGLDTFGYPVSGLLLEDVDGTSRLVQYFEKARLAYYPARDDVPSQVRPAMLGRAYLEQHPLPESVLAPAPAVVKLAEATTPYYGEDSHDGHNVVLGAQRMHGQVVMPGEVLSFLDSIGPITAQAGFVDGYGIVNYEIVPVIGGGICQVSTVLYEVAMEAGLEIVERHNHSYALSFFADQPGIESAVYVDAGTRQDLRWRNDTAYPLHLVTTRNPETSEMHVALWGASDGRSVELRSEVAQTYAPGEIWELDEEMEEGTYVQYSAGSPGMDVLTHRRVTDGEGNIIHVDRVVTSYAARSAVFHHGPGGNPNDPTPTASATPTAEPTAEATPTPEVVQEQVQEQEEVPPTAQPTSDATPTPLIHRQVDEPQVPTSAAPTQAPAAPTQAPGPTAPAGPALAPEEPAPPPEEPEEPAPPPEEPEEPAPPSEEPEIPPAPGGATVE
jgi:hypothetical protein